MFVLPDDLPATVVELDELRDKAQKDINVIQARHEAGEELSRDDVENLRGLLDAVDAIDTARGEAAAAEEAHRASVAELIGRATTPASGPEDEEEADEDTESEVVTEAEAIVEEAASVTASTEIAVAASRKPVTFSTGMVDAPATQKGPGWEMSPNAPGYRPGRVGFRELALAIDTVKPGSRGSRTPSGTSGAFATQVLARLQRDVPLIEDSHALVAAINEATDQSKLPGGSLTAAGGWCAPSEQLYDFCDVPDATDLISLPEITINRGGIRWPQEPDLSAIFNSFQFFFTEPQLEAVDSNGAPTAIKQCVEIPCPDQFDEIRLNAVGYCVEAGILQTQGWPELIEWFMRSLAAEHLRAISRRTIEDMVSGSGSAIVINPDTTIGAAGSALNSLALMAVNLRLNKGLARNATIEGVAPSWFAEVLRADLALQEGLAVKSVTDAVITGWLSDRNIALQFVGDWQTRTTGKPGDLATKVWPATVDVLLYPAGTWFRSMSNVIELGVMYPKEQLQVNRYTRFFTEDAIAVGKRCNQSILVTVPLCPSGAIGARQMVACNNPTP